MNDFYYLEHLVRDDKLFVRYYGAKGRSVEKAPLDPYCYVKSITSTVDSKCAKSHIPLTKYEFELPSEVYDLQKDQATWEGDIMYERRMMSDLDLKVGTVRKCYMDIETDYSGVSSNAAIDEIISIAMLFDDGREVFVSREDYTEEEMLDIFVKEMENVGMVITWNGGEDVWESRSFDIPYMAKRYKSEFELDKALKHVCLIDLMRHYKYRKISIGEGLAGGYSLENVSQNELGRGKIKHSKPIKDMSPDELKEYNMMDVILLKEIDEKLSLTDLSISIARTCNLRLTGWNRNKRRSEIAPIRQIDQLFLKTCRELGVAWPTMDYRKAQDQESITGAMVLEPKVGLFDNVQNMDVTSMYPSIMINERYSPDKDREIMPTLLKDLLTKRREFKAKYKETNESKYNVWQYAYKVVANTVYGATSNPTFRGYNREIAQAITTKGQSLLTQIKDLVEEMGFDVLYGDTDSVFVRIEPEPAEALSRSINRIINPYKLECGEYYNRMLFTGNEHGGIKKRYAGLLPNGDVYVKGLESTRGEYSVLARETQFFVLGKLLSGGTVDDCKKCLFNLKKAMKEGKYDDWLVMTKKVRDLGEYSKKRTYPPHVRALEKAYDMGHRGLYEINYFWTLSDVEPYVNDKIPKNIDYEHYFQNQILNVVTRLFDSIRVQNGGRVGISKGKKKAASECESLATWS